MVKRILVTGASIAGCTVASCLARHGFEVEVVERAPAFRTGGQNIDVRGVGREVLRRLGLERAALDRGTTEEGTAWVDADDRAVARFVTATLGGDGPTAEMEILRGELADILYRPGRELARFRFGDAVVAVDQDQTDITVAFESGALSRYDAMIVAEGTGSTTRGLVFPGEARSRWMDLTIAYFTIAREPSDDRMWRWYNAPGGISASLRPDNLGTTRAMLAVHRPPGGEEDWARGRQIAWLRERFADAGWKTGRILRGMAGTDDFYLDVLRQVRMPRWANGRIAITGDAAWCATPLAGIGTTLAVTGAYVLAEEIARSPDDIGAAFSAYEAQMRPMVGEGQGVPKIGPRLMHPRTRAGIRILHGALALASRPLVRSVTGRLFANKPTQPDLSRYPAA